MEPNEDIAAPDIDTVEMPLVAPNPAPEPPGAPNAQAAADAPLEDETPLEDAETAVLNAAGPVGVTDVSDENTMQFAAADAAVQSDLTQADTVVETPAVLMPVVQMPGASRATETTRGASSRFARLSRHVWLRYPEFWLAVALAAFLRLWHIDLSSFLDDQTGLMRLARGVWLHGALPVTGIPSSIGTLNAPLSVYLLMPFTLFGKDPLPATISIALWNALGVAFCYIFAHRYFGRIIAASSAVLFASCASAVHFSAFIWQQNYLAPVLALWIFTLYRGCISGRRGWFVPHVALLILALQLHPIVALLIPVSLVGLLLTPRQALPRRREWLLAVVVAILLLAPTLLWEAISRGSDLRAFAHYLTQPGSFNLDVFRMLYGILGAPALGEFGPNSLYAQMGPWATAINIAAVLFFVAGLVVLTERLLRVGVYVWRDGASRGANRASRWRGGVRAVWQGLRAEATWRAHLLLWLWLVIPIVLLLRHSNALTVPYLLILYPAVFIAGGFAVQAAFRLAEKWMPRAALAHQLAPAAILTALTVLILAQAAQAALFPATLATGSFSAFPGYGYPLAETQQLDAALGALQAEQNAHAIFISLPQAVRYRAPLDYLTISEHPDRVGSAADCLVLPAPDEQPALVTALPPAGPASAMISSLPQLKLVANLTMAGSGAIAVYQMQGTLPPLLGERPLTPVSFTDARGGGLRLDAVAIQPDGMVRLRWTVLGSAATNQGASWYRITPTVRSANGGAHAAPATDCQPTRWRAGETVFTWVAANVAGAQSLLLQVRSATHLTTLKAGPINVLAGGNYNTTPELLRPSSGTVAADGTLTVPLSQTP